MKKFIKNTFHLILIQWNLLHHDNFLQNFMKDTPELTTEG